jgi:hypothetical protein
LTKKQRGRESKFPKKKIGRASKKTIKIGFYLLYTNIYQRKKPTKIGFCLYFNEPIRNYGRKRRNHMGRQRLAPKRINIHMFKNLFKRKTELERLQGQHAMLLEKAFKASKVNRTLSDELMAQAYAIEQKIFKETNK